MSLTITERWRNEILNPSKNALIKTINDVFLDDTLPEVSITNGDIILDINKNGMVYLDDQQGNEFYMRNVDEIEMKKIWFSFANKNIKYIYSLPWIEGIPAFNDD